jgi:hypothetical protein
MDKESIGETGNLKYSSCSETERMETTYEKSKHKREHNIKTDLKEERGEGVGRFIGHRKLTSGGLLRHSNELPDFTKCGEFLNQQRIY